MKLAILALAIGIAVGYNWGYGEGTDGKKSVVERTVERFGTSKVKAAQDARNKRVDDVK